MDRYSLKEWVHGCAVAFTGAMVGAAIGIFIAWTQIPEGYVPPGAA